MSGKSHSLLSYNDVKYILDIALRTPGLTYEVESSGKATYFIQRCNKYRKLLREQQAELLQNVPGASAGTSYDILVIRKVNQRGESDRDGRFILFEHVKPTGVLRGPDGQQIDLPLSVNPEIADE